MTHETLLNINVAIFFSRDSNFFFVEESRDSNPIIHYIVGVLLTSLTWHSGLFKKKKLYYSLNVRAMLGTLSFEHSLWHTLFYWVKSMCVPPLYVVPFSNGRKYIDFTQ